MGYVCDPSSIHMADRRLDTKILIEQPKMQLSSHRRELGIHHLEIRGHFRLVVDQVTKESNYHNEKMAACCQEVCKLEDRFNKVELKHIPRRLNEVKLTLSPK
jgi:hypothetical protein